LCLISGSDRKTTVATITDDSNMARRHPPGHNPQRRGEREGKHADIYKAKTPSNIPTR